MKKPETIRKMLGFGLGAGFARGNRLAVGRAKEVAALLIKNPRRTAQVIECLWDEDPGVANRAADALERASCSHPKLLAPWKDALLGRIVDATENKLLEPGADDFSCRVDSAGDGAGCSGSSHVAG